MKFAATVPLICSTLLSAIASIHWLSPVNAQVQPLPPSSPSPINPEDPNTLRPATETSNLLSIKGGQRLMSEASSAVSSQNYPVASSKLKEARIVFNQLSNSYQQLFSSFSGIDNRVADTLRKRALETAQMRDEATYQLALVHRAQNKPELALPLLVQIIKSQNPTRPLGKKAYQQLFELGFVDSPFPREQRNSSSSKK
ncbi:MAG: hypothetical protein QNJ63_11350 [Calothrix sp. MO_192.B10]|nr:hypothetical protein [Calothrix sp. MO_192.B10]